jgi:hypothetical protein
MDIFSGCMINQTMNMAGAKCETYWGRDMVIFSSCMINQTTNMAGAKCETYWGRDMVIFSGCIINQRIWLVPNGPYEPSSGDNYRNDIQYVLFFKILILLQYIHYFHR